MAKPGAINPPEEALLDLLVKQVTEGLSPEEERALDAQDNALASTYGQDFEQAVAAISLAACLSDNDMPSAALSARIEQEAQAFFANTPVSKVRKVRDGLPPRLRPSSRVSAAGWYAAAACLVLAAIGWLRSPPPITSPPTANVPVVVPPIVALPAPTPAPPTPAEERAALLALPGSVKVILSATKDPAAQGVTADAVWDPVTQRGFLHIVGLKPNDPRIEQYQAWVFDAERDKRYPLSAGVFDTPADSPEVIVPIHAELPVQMAKAFAVTLEKPRGVVVPALKHVVVLGAVG